MPFTYFDAFNKICEITFNVKVSFKMFFFGAFAKNCFFVFEILNSKKKKHFLVLIFEDAIDAIILLTLKIFVPKLKLLLQS